MKEEKVTCKKVMKHICDTLGEDFDSERCANIKQHVEECSNCKSYLETVELTIGYYQKYNVNLPEDAHQRLMKFLDLEDCD